MDKKISPAVVEHVMQENVRLREGLRKIVERCELFIHDEADMRTHSVEVLMGIAEDALSRQAEPAGAQDERDSEISHIELCITNLKAAHQSSPRVIAEVLHNIGYSRATRPAQTELAEQSGLVVAAKGALGAIQDALDNAYQNAYPECCGQAHLECCGSPVQAWSEADQRTMERFTPHEKALRAALAAQGGE